jgi:hypothetical protein
MAPLSAQSFLIALVPALKDVHPWGAIRRRFRPLNGRQRTPVGVSAKVAS